MAVINNYPVMNNSNQTNSQVLGITAPTIHSNYQDIIDTYNDIQEIKNNSIAVTIANHRKNKERAGAAFIGATWGVLQGAFFAGVYSLAKVVPSVQKVPFIKWLVGNLDKWVQRSQQLHPNKSLKYHIVVGMLSKTFWLVLSGAALGIGADLYSTYANTRITGRISNTKQGNINDSGLLSALNSLSYSPIGKSAVKNAVKVNDDKSVTVSLKGVDKEYTIAKQELKSASKAYDIDFDDKGRVKKYAKKYSKGDGDVLAFELAFEKYMNDLKNGNINQNKKIPGYVQNSPKDDSLLFERINTNQVYYLLTGRKSAQIDMKKKPETDAKGLNSLNLYSKSYYQKFMDDFAKNPNSYAAACKFDIEEPITLLNKHHEEVKLLPESTYAIKKIGKKSVTIVDSKKSRVGIEIPVDDFKSKLASIYFTDLSGKKSNSALLKYAELSE